MAHPDRDFLIRRRLLLAVAPAFLAAPALANLGPDLLKGGVAKFALAKEPKTLPELGFTDADDKPLSLADYKDKLVVVPLSLDSSSRAKVAPFYADQKLANLGIYFDKGKKALGALDVSVLPTS